MNNNFLNSARVKMSVFALSFGLMVFSVQAQDQHPNANVRAGEKALLEGDFKSAVTHLQKAFPAEAKDANVHYLLGYAQFQNGDFKKAADTFGKVVQLDAKNSSAYYYKAKANNNVAVNQEEKLSAKQREVLLRSSIEDYSKALVLDQNDVKLYQNRGTAYRDLGVLTGTSGTPNYNKQSATDAYNKAIVDFEKVLSYDASKKDIQTEAKKARVYRDNLK